MDSHVNEITFRGLRDIKLNKKPGPNQINIGHLLKPFLWSYLLVVLPGVLAIGIFVGLVIMPPLVGWVGDADIAMLLIFLPTMLLEIMLGALGMHIVFHKKTIKGLSFRFNRQDGYKPTYQETLKAYWAVMWRLGIVRIVVGLGFLLAVGVIDMLSGTAYTGSVSESEIWLKFMISQEAFILYFAMLIVLCWSPVKVGPLVVEVLPNGQ